MSGNQVERDHVERARRAIALVTAFSDTADGRLEDAAGLVATFLEEETHPAYLLSAVAAVAAVLVKDLAVATGSTPERHLQALGRAAAMLG